MNLRTILSKKLPVEKFHQFLISMFIKQEKKVKYPEKHHLYYAGIIGGFKKWPNTVKLLMEKMHMIGTYKDYLYLFKNNSGEFKSDKFENFLVELIVKRLLEDEQQLKKGGSTSLLAKHLPNESSVWQKKYRIVTKISKALFPDVQNERTAHRRYRKLIVSLRRNNNQPEEHLVTGRFDLMDPSGMNLHFVNRNIKHILKNQELEKKLIMKYYLQYSAMNLWEIIHSVDKDKLNCLQKKGLNKLWKERINEFTREVHDRKLNINNDTILLDIGPECMNMKKKTMVMVYGFLFKLCGFNVYLNKPTLEEFNVNINEDSLDSFSDLIDKFSLEMSSINEPSTEISNYYGAEKRVIMITGSHKSILHNDNFKTIYMSYDNQLFNINNCWNMKLGFKPIKNYYFNNLRTLLNSSPDIKIENKKRNYSRAKVVCATTIGMIATTAIIYGLSFVPWISLIEML